MAAGSRMLALFGESGSNLRPEGASELRGGIRCPPLGVLDPVAAPQVHDLVRLAFLVHFTHLRCLHAPAAPRSAPPRDGPTPARVASPAWLKLPCCQWGLDCARPCRRCQSLWRRCLPWFQVDCAAPDAREITTFYWFRTSSSLRLQHPPHHDSTQYTPSTSTCRRDSSRLRAPRPWRPSSGAQLMARRPERLLLGRIKIQMKFTFCIF